MWYDLLSLIYDRSLESLYRPFRVAAVEALRLHRGAHVLDVPCGTGQSFDLLVTAVGPSGNVLGVDYSGGMLSKARKRVKRAGWNSVELRRAAAADVDAKFLETAVGRPFVDGVLCSLGLSVLADWEAAFESLFLLVQPGGRFVLFDVYARERTISTLAVELGARADLSRQAWRLLENRCQGFRRDVLSIDHKKFGGEL